jgi:peptidoglycan hydrolase-like amidase/peptidoglycan hydrolase CwlO-like protein
MPILNYRRPSTDSQGFMITTLFVILIALLITGFVYADDLDDELRKIEKKIEKKEKEYESTSKKLNDVKSRADSVAQRITQLSSQLSVTQWEISSLQNDINQLEGDLDLINEILGERRETLQEKIQIRNSIVRNYSKRGVLNDLEIFLRVLPLSKSLTGFQYATYHYIFEKTFTTDMIAVIGGINNEINEYEREKKEAEDLKVELESSQQSLLAIASQLALQTDSERQVLGGLQNEQSSLENHLSDLAKAINELSAEQQSILAAKAGDGLGTVGDYEQAEQKLPKPGFSPAFAASSYGAYTHYNGMSQYGAKGRAEEGHSYKDIIKFYYKTDVKKESSFPKKIAVQGHGELDFQYYLYGIAEMPSNWPMEALKAQAIAARTYAYRASKPICTTEYCQVFLKSKADNVPTRWKEAVDSTKDMILSGGTTSQYSSTTGGYINNVGWDTYGSWPAKAYEKKAGSPWFFKAWYTQGYSPSSSTCGLSSPWLDDKEMADILNALVVWEKGTSSDRDRISPITTSCWGGKPYSMKAMAERADELGGGYSRVNHAKVEISNGGFTSVVILQTDRGEVRVDGTKFRTAFNLRAPGYIALKSRLYDFVLN